MSGRSLSRSPGALGGRQRAEAGEGGGVSPWRLGQYLRLRLERPQRCGGVQAAGAQVCVCVCVRACLCVFVFACVWGFVFCVRGCK